MRKLFLLLMTLFITSMGMLRANELTVFEGTQTNGYIPMYGLYCDAFQRSQFVMPSSELDAMEGGQISAMKFYTSSNYSSVSWTSTFSVYLKEVASSTISAYIDPTSATEVYRGTLSVVNNVMTVTFTTPYTYEGGNLLIGFDCVQKGNYASCFFNGQTVNNSSVSGYSYNSLAAVNMYQRNFLPKTTFTFTGGAPVAALSVEPDPVNLGSRPNGAWMRPFEATVTSNIGTTQVTAIDVDNPYFVMEGLELPATVSGSHGYTFNITTGEAEEGRIEATLALLNGNGRAATLVPITAYAYDPERPDVWELARVVTSFPYTERDPNTYIADNYQLPGTTPDGPDEVFKVTFANDVVFNTDFYPIVNKGEGGRVGYSFKSAIYAEDFNGEPGPGPDNAFSFGVVEGEFFEDFETGTLSQQWSNDASYPWTVTGGAYAGNFCAKSGNNGVGSSESKLTLNYTVPVDGVVAFYMKFSGEGSSWDIPKFYLDGVLKTPANSWPSGGNDWTRYEYPVTAGAHTFTWAYKKDSSINQGQDCAWVDNITIGTPADRSNDVITDMFVPAGTYYVVTSAKNVYYDVTLRAEAAPAPVVASNPTPADGAQGISTPVTLEWTLGNYTAEYQLVMGTTYPPTEVVVDWTSNLAESYRTETLFNNTQYFWQINERNSTGTTNGPVWGFTTTINVPQNFAVADNTLFEGQAAQFSWQANNRAFRGYNIYQDGVKLNNALITTTSYTVTGLTYNMDGYDFNVTSVYDEGESEYSNTVVVYVSGDGIVSGHVYEQDGDTPIQGATVTLTGHDEFNDPHTITFTTNENGYYGGNLYAGVYSAVATLEGYQDTPYGAQITIEYAEETSDIDFIMNEVYYPVLEVVAEEVDDSMVKVYWSSYVAPSIIEDFETGTFDSFEWNNTISSYPWAITTTNPYEGTYCMKSTCEGVGSGNSAIEVTVEIPSDGLMSFYGKISCENNWDYGYFYIDGVQKGQYTGAGNWAQREFDITAGTHTFKWTYVKDATVNSNDDCFYVDLIDFCHQPEPAQPGWIHYDDGTNTDAIGLNGGGSFYWGIMFPASQMAAYNGYNLTKVAYFDYAAHTGKVMIYQGGDTAPGTLIHQQNYTANGTNQYVEWDLTSAIPVDPTKNLWIVMNNDGGTYIAACGENTGNANGRWISLDGTTWEDVASYGLSVTWNLRGFVTNRNARNVSVAADNVVELTPLTFVNNATGGVLGSDPKAVDRKPVVAAPAMTETRAFQYYNIYRTGCYDEEEIQLMASHVTDTVYMDMSWGNTPAGVYKWGVSRVYEGNRESRIQWANPTRESYTYNFDDGIQGWTTIDADGDGWMFRTLSSLLGYTGNGHNGSDDAVCSQSYDNSYGVLFPDNYLVSPVNYGLGTGASISFYACGQDANYAAEHFGVAVSTTSNTSAAEFTTIQEWTLTAKGTRDAGPRGTRVQGNWYQFTADLSAYAGQHVWIALRHFNCSDEYVLNIDDVTISTGEAIVPPTPGGEHESDIVWSNCLDKDMWTTVDVTVTTNSQDSPEGTTVTLVNMTEPEMGYDLEVELDDTGYHIWDEVRKGTYVVTMNKEGFESCYIEDEIEIWDATSLECMLEEIIFSVEGLYTSHTGWAMWTGGENINPTPNPTEGDEFEFNFDTDMSGWTTIDADGDGNNFAMLSSIIASNGAGHNGSNDALGSQSYINYVGPLTPDNYVVSPQKYAIGGNSVFSFWACGQDSGYPAEHFGVAISTTGNTSAADFTTIQEWTLTAKGERYEGPRGSRAQGNWYNYTVDLSAYAGQEVWIAVRHFNCTDWFVLDVDDFVLSNGRRGERSIEMYKVMLDGVFEGNTTRNFFQHNVENLVEGEEYTTQVQAIYSTGASEWSEYTWVYIPCDNFQGTVDGVTAEVVGEDVLISWTYPTNDTITPNPNGDEFEFNFDSDMSGWTTIDADGDGNNFAMLSSIIASNGAGHNGSNDALGSQSYINYVGPLTPDNYVVSPQKYAIGSSSVFSFWACGQDSGYAAEHFGVAISTTGNTSAADFTTIQEWTLTAKGERYEGKRGSRAQGNWYNFTADLSAYAGQEVWIAVRHFNCTDMFVLDVDDFVLSCGARTRDILFDQSQMVTNPGAGVNGADVSALQGGQGTFAPNVNWAYGNGAYYLLADDFTLEADATIEEIEVYAYQTGSSTTSTMTGMYIQIYDGNPMSGGQVIWGDNATNLMTSTAFTGIYRTTSTEFTNTQRPIMSVTASGLNIALSAGQYWVQWGLTGSSSSGPWGMPVCIPGQTTTGDGLQKQDVGWANMTDGSTGTQLGAAFKISGTGGNNNGGGANVLGAVIFRDGEYLAFTENSEYVDVNPGDGDFEYCVRIVHNGPMDGTYFSMSCPECAEVSMELTCEAPNNLNGEYVWNTADEFGAMISWGELVIPVESWLFYDDGANVDAIGLQSGGSFYWGIMIPSAMLQPYAGTSLTKVAYFDYAAHTGKVMIYQGGATAPGTLVHQQNYTANGTAQYVEWELTAAIPVDVTQNLWIVMNNDGGQYVAACGNDTGDANGRWVSIDGTEWMDITAAGIQATWNLRGFVTNTRTGELIPVEAPALNGTPGATLANAGVSRQGDVVMDFTARDLALVSYKVYRSTSNANYSLIATVPAVAGQDYYEYFDQVEAGTYYYQVTAYYEGTSGTCESEPAISATNSANNYVIVAVTSVDGADLNARVYPNPTNGNVTIEAVGMKQITVVSALGQVIYDREVNSDSEMLNMAEYKAGIYMVRIATENGVSVQRVTVVR